MTSLSISDYQRTKPLEINLWGVIFEYVRVTKKTEPEINDALAAIDKGFAGEDTTKHAIQAKVFASRMDVRLARSAGGRKKASTLIREKWESGDLTMPQCDHFWEAVEEAVEGGLTGPVLIEAFAGAAVEVDLWGEDFEAIRVTALTEPEIDAQLAEIATRFAGKELTHDVQVEIFGARFDARLKPTKEGGPKASELIKARWDEGELDVPQLQQFWTAVLEAIDRPS
jgi:hypothetical protein